MIKQIVDLDDATVRRLVLEEAKRQIKEETGKDPTGSSHTTFEKNTDGKVSATIQFQCNGKRP